MFQVQSTFLNKIEKEQLKNDTRECMDIVALTVIYVHALHRQISHDNKTRESKCTHFNWFSVDCLIIYRSKFECNVTYLQINDRMQESHEKTNDFIFLCIV